MTAGPALYCTLCSGNKKKPTVGHFGDTLVKSQPDLRKFAHLWKNNGILLENVRVAPPPHHSNFAMLLHYLVK